jgi:hypothetical protein
VKPIGNLAGPLLALFTAAGGTAQCIVDNPGGSRANIYRPSDSDVPDASFSPLRSLNEKLPPWICFTMGYRARWEGDSASRFVTGATRDYLLTRYRVGTALSATSWLKSYVELQDADVFWKDPKAAPYQSTWDLRRAYVDLGDLEKDHFAFRIGRQDLNFGWARLLGTSYWRNASTGYDAVLGVFNDGRFRVSAFSASRVTAYANGMSHHQPGNDIHGLYGRIRNLIKDGDIEPYVFWRVAPGIENEAGKFGKLDEKIAGMRLAGARSNFDYDGEITGEFGHYAGDQIRAWAWSGIIGYTIPTPKLRPRVAFKYDYASGDRNPKDGVRGTFDQLYPNIHDHHGLADQIAWENLVSYRTVVRVPVLKEWMVSVAFNDWYLASANDAFYNSSGSVVVRDTKGLSGRHIGYEWDAQTSYRLNKDVEIGTGVGRIISGSLLTRLGKARAYTYPYLLMQYNFF